MGDCDICSGDDALSFRCNFCGGLFCRDHRLPEKHGCMGEASIERERERIAYGADKTTPQSGGDSSRANRSPAPTKRNSRTTDGDTVDLIIGLLLLPLFAAWKVSRFLASLISRIGVIGVSLATNPTVIVLVLVSTVAISATVGTGIGPIDQAVQDGIEAGQKYFDNVSEQRETPDGSESTGISNGGSGSGEPTTTESLSADDVSTSAIESAIHAEVNEVRQEHGLSTLATDSKLQEIARYHSEDMADSGYIAHTSPTGETVEDRYDRFNYNCRVPTGGNTYITGAENVAQTYAFANIVGSGSYGGDEEDIGAGIVEQWMESSGHRENILKDYWGREGIGVALKEAEGEMRVYATQNFC